LPEINNPGNPASETKKKSLKYWRQNVIKDPEIYPREDGTVYVCGESDHFPLPEDPALVSADGVDK
jgi:hypothetical protein